MINDDQPHPPWPMPHTNPNDDSLPQQLGRWRRGAAIGEGGAGRVYLAEHVDTGAVGALKVAHSTLRTVQKHWFRREAALAARLRHRSIVPVLDSGDAGGQPFVVYEHIPGPTLAAVADELSVQAIVAIGNTLLEALIYAHDAGVVHCDITPANIILVGTAPHREIRLIDFGLAKSLGERSRAKAGATVSGTPGYLSPEQARGSTLVGPSSDLFGCGAVLFRLLSGYAPYAGVTTTSSSLSLAPPMRFGDRHGPMDSSPLAQVVLKLLAEDPEMRYASASAALRAWQDAASEQPLSTDIPARQVETKPLITLHTEVASTAYSVGQHAAPAEMPAPHETTLVGRDLLVKRLADQVRQGKTRSIALHGERGTGKSRVVQELVRVLEADQRVVRVGGRRGVSGPPLECVAAIVADFCGTATEPLWRSAERLHLLVASLDLSDPSSAEDALVGGLLGAGPSRDARTSAMAIVEVLERLVGDERTLIIVDDADEIDDASVEVLDATIAQPDSKVCVLRVGTERVDGASNVELPPLKPDEREHLWAAIGGKDDVPAGTLADLTALATTARITDAERSGFDALPQSTATFLAVVASFGDDVPLRGPSEVIGTSGHLPVLLRAGLLTVVERACARRERWVRIPSGALERWARARGLVRYSTPALRWLSRCSQDASHSNLQRVAAIAERLGMHATAAHAWAEAGNLALRAQRPASAVLSLERALAEDPEETALDRPRVLAQLAAAHGDKGDAAAQDARAAQALELVQPERVVLKARLLRLRSTAAFEMGENERALALLQRAVALIGADGDPMESASCHASLGWLLGYRLGRNEEGIALGREAMRIASKIVAPAFQASLCGRLGANYLRAGDWDGQLRTNMRDLELSKLGGDIYGQVRANINLGVCFTNRGALGTAREYTAMAYDLGVRHGARRAALIAANNMAMIAVHDDKADEASLWIERVRAEVGDGDLPTETSLSLARVHVLRGNRAEARDAFQRAKSTADHADLDHVARVAAMIELADGSPEGALSHTAPVLLSDVTDPYERATTKLTHAAALDGLQRGDEAAALRKEAEETLSRLGANLELETLRWS